MKSTQKTENVHGQCENFALGIQRDLYSTDSCQGFALGVTLVLLFALGVTQILAFLDTNMLVFPPRNFALDSQREVFSRRSGI